MSIAGVLIDVGVRATVNLVTNVVWYSCKGVWWLGKRAIYGRPRTVEERHKVLVIEQRRQTDDIVTIQTENHSELLAALGAMHDRISELETERRAAAQTVNERGVNCTSATSKTSVEVVDAKD